MKVTCPYCGRKLQPHNGGGRYSPHSIEPASAMTCPMSEQRVAPTGMTPADCEKRARLIAELAAQVQDEDPHLAWIRLTCLPDVELQRLLMFALAAIDLDQTVTDMWGWVCDLPIARRTA